jgi:hypothetical protein
MAKPESKCVYYILEKGTEYFAEKCRSEICAMLLTKGSSTYAELTHMQEKKKAAS